MKNRWQTLKILVYLLVFVNFILVGLLFFSVEKEVYEFEIANITDVVDGDTIKSSIGKIRLLGVNTPEKYKRGYEDAKYFLEQFEGKEIKLLKGKDNEDRYGRLLRYVFYKDRNINKEILERGLGHLYYYFEDEFTYDLKLAEERARKYEIGIWEKSSDICAGCIILVELNEIDPGEYIILGNICNYNCNLQDWTIKDDSASHIRKLDFNLEAKNQKTINYEGRIWNDAGDSLYLRDKSGLLVLWYRY